ncbi:hypothetical protein [Microcoleus sp. FACHB-SPT15]|uniref:hypothetical protein n=1 Tax=Microcoleus sp. FACHB-SPT15 TaxID=2692830 RepID=UPI001F5594BD|nr:hypothetical protein [Microcoleus sp. FACHB-SPT15]
MVKPVSGKSVNKTASEEVRLAMQQGEEPLASATCKGYRSQTEQQVLETFCINQLLSHLSSYVDEDFDAALMNLNEHELDCLAATLIQRLMSSLKGKQIASYLNAIRHGDSDVLCDPSHLELPLPTIELPVNFPNGVTPSYKEGDRVRWQALGENTDWGIVIGRYYTYAQHRCDWGICYLIRLDKDSPSAAWTVTDTAWEEDIEAIASSDTDFTKGENSLPSLEGKQLVLPLFPEQHPPKSESSTTLLRSLAHPLIPKSLHLRLPPGTYNPGRRDRNNPRMLTQREQNLIELYSQCQLGMAPRRFYSKWFVSYEHLASICDRSISTVRRWFMKGSNHRRPTRTDLRHLALMDFLLEHFEEIPSNLRNLLYSANLGQ